MSDQPHHVQIKRALVSVYHKDGLASIARQLHQLGVTIFSTGGTEKFLKELAIPVQTVESLTTYPSILGGRVKTLHPAVFAGILARKDYPEDQKTLQDFKLPAFDLVIVDLYPFEETLRQAQKDPTLGEEAVIEKIDIGGISLIRAAAKNYWYTTVIASRNDYAYLEKLMQKHGNQVPLADRKKLAENAFAISSQYDTAIHAYFKKGLAASKAYPTESQGGNLSIPLRYGENPHQKAVYQGDLSLVFEQLHGKDLSYNNLLDIDAGLSLLDEFTLNTLVIIKHGNACGLASVTSADEAVACWKKALAGDPISAFGGVIAYNCEVNLDLAKEIDALFFEVLIAPSFTADAMAVLSKKKKRILLKRKAFTWPTKQHKTLLNGTIEQDRDVKVENASSMACVTKRKPTEQEINDLVFANKVAKHTKSNAIVLVRNEQLLSSGMGQTSRVDSLKYAILKAKALGVDLQGAAMASDAFFPFPDCVQIAAAAGITAIAQPGGSIKDQDSIEQADEDKLSMVFTGIRHFKH